MMNYLRDWQPLIETVNVLATAILSFWVALLIRTQNRLIDTQVRVEAQERRLALFDAIMVFLANITMSGSTNSDELRQMQRETRHAQFVFPKEAKIRELVKELYQQGLELEYCEKQIASAGASSPIATLVQKSTDLKKWFAAKRADIEAQFERYLAVQEL